MDDTWLDRSQTLYRQEARVGLFQMRFPYAAMAKPMLQYLPVDYGNVFAFCKDTYMVAMYYENDLKQVALALLETFKDGFPPEWRARWEKVDTELTATSRELKDTDLAALSLENLQAKYDALTALHEDMWAQSISIDTLDPGYDHAAMQVCATKYGFADEEVALLSAAPVPAYTTEWDLALAQVAAGKVTREQLRERFFWYAVNYSSFRELDDAFVDDALNHPHPPTLPAGSEEADRTILATHKLTRNPLQPFRDLMVWRDERKRLNYVGLYGLVKIAREFLRRKNIDPELVNGMFPFQLPDVLSGKLASTDLERQLSDGVFMHQTLDTFELSFGTEAQAQWQTLSEQYNSLHAGNAELKGTVASKGKAQGRARIILDFTDPRAATFAKGDVLVTAMTRPEFLPLMKRAGAIVTDEGGVTSHAAIVSRELKIPCIIGTKNATTTLKDGDMVEVDAEQGIVRIIEKAV